jgi:hypothetical protein
MAAAVLAMGRETDSALSDDDELSLRLGRVAREHARLEYGLDHVLRMLDASKEGAAPTSVGELVHRCQRLLNGSGLEADIIRAGRGALSSASSATAQRNRA